MAAAPRYVEDMSVGEIWPTGPIVLTDADLVAFAQAYDPQPWHVDAQAAGDGPFGGLIASGWHLTALMMRALIDAKPMGATPLLGMGIDALRWLRPARPGDILQVTWEVLEVRRSASKPDRGIARAAATMTNHEGETVMTLTATMQVPARPG
jgi:acyl dehydratase